MDMYFVSDTLAYRPRTSKEILTVTLDTIHNSVCNQTIKFTRETSKDTAKLGENIISELGVGMELGGIAHQSLCHS